MENPVSDAVEQTVCLDYLKFKLERIIFDMPPKKKSIEL